MFNTPIHYTRVKDLENLREFSYMCDGVSQKSKVFWQNNGQIAFVDEWCHIYVTPYRPEVQEILREEGYIEDSIYVPFSNRSTCPKAYEWLKKIADEECWQYTYEEAYKISMEKGIKPVTLEGKYHVREISYYLDTETNTIYEGLTMKYLHNGTDRNIGTYILVNEKTLIICDEYGRSFLLTAKAVVNDIVNKLLDAGYTRTIHPERYIHEYQPKQEEDN